ncbi:XRE family transcriptional regulator [Sphingosinicella sp. BN140058]|uniref:XRE family transcriptional regulator n=1 Tax=Sphingosinicella sp. BN140058 TaxID=1892855 RepID=UPI001011997A|nr:XRE family transcriptional regulator [Sphingosinicella sp. BN140058]QAY79419.1 XRE family transcriptional regulator [Sphingosinicella sp. BN140058]
MDVVQCKMARAALEWEPADLAEASGLETRAIARFEDGGAVLPGHLRAMRAALETAGIAFLGDDGVRLSGAAQCRHIAVQQAL